MKSARWWRMLRVATAPALAGLALLLVVWLATHRPRPTTLRLTLTAGRNLGQRHHLAQLLVQEAAQQHLEISLAETAGSEEALRRLKEGDIDVALVQGGLRNEQFQHVRQVAALQLEPLHLLVKEEIYDDVALHLSALRNRTINLGEPGSGTHALAQAVLAFSGLQPKTAGRAGDFIASQTGYRALQAETDAAKLPDALFMVQSLPSPLARHFIVRHGYRIVPLPFAEAFSLNGLDGGDAGAVELHQLVDNAHVSETVVPAFTYSVEPPVPAEATRTLGTRLLVVAREGLANETVERLLNSIFFSEFVQIARPPLDPALMDIPAEFPLHEGTAQLAKRNKPLLAADLVDYSEKVVAIGATAIGGFFFFWQSLSQWQSRRQERSFRKYLVQITNLEQQLFAMEQGAVLDLRRLLELQAELNAVKQEALRRYAADEIEGEHVVTGFLTLVNDTRNYATRLILHERENIEERAAALGETAGDIWRISVGQNASEETPPATTTESRPRVD